MFVWIMRGDVLLGQYIYMVTFPVRCTRPGRTWSDIDETPKGEPNRAHIFARSVFACAFQRARLTSAHNYRACSYSTLWIQFARTLCTHITTIRSRRSYGIWKQAQSACARSASLRTGGAATCRKPELGPTATE